MTRYTDQQLAKSNNPNDFIITRKRKLYKFASFNNLNNCFDEASWLKQRQHILNDNRPICLEIGAGTALFSTKLAQQSPERLFLAIDRKSDRLYTGAKLANELRLNNIYYIWLNANNISRLVPNNSIDEIWITFPDPWPQDSNAKHRLTNRSKLDIYRQLLKVGGRLKFKTDNRPLFDWSLTQFDSHWQIDYLTNNLHQDDNAPADATVTTTYEERYMAEGKPINCLIATVV